MDLLLLSLVQQRVDRLGRLVPRMRCCIAETTGNQGIKPNVSGPCRLAKNASQHGNWTELCEINQNPTA